MADQITIPARFRGPPQSGNGGYVAGAIAACFEPTGLGESNAVQVTLRAPIPLDTPMAVEIEAGQLTVTLADQLIAEAERCTLNMEVPTPPSFAEARAGRAASPSFYHSFNPLIPDGTGFHPVCVCCGADVPAEEGLHVYAGPVPGFAGVAAAWHPHPRFADADGLLPTPIIWTALDCPGQFAYMVDGIRTGLLGRMTAQMIRPARADDDLVVIGWRLEIERRKHFAGTALFDGTGELCAVAMQTWIGRMDSPRQ